MNTNFIKKIKKGINWYFDKTFNFHPKSLTLFRISLGCIICFNAVVRLLDLETHYGPSGISPIDFVLNKRLSEGQWSLYLLNESIWLPGILLTITAISGILLSIGYKAKYIKWICWVLIMSVNVRNYDYINSGDILLQLLLLWSLILPIENPTKKINKVAAFGYTLQIACMYWFVVFSRKGSTIWHEKKTAVRDVLHIDQFTTPAGKLLLQAPSEILFALNDMVMLVELFAPIGLFIPYVPIQIIAAITLMLLHTGFIVTLALGLFGFVCITALIPFIRFKQQVSYKKQKKSPITTFAAIALIILLIWGNLWTHAGASMPFEIQKISHALGIRQKWKIFSKPMINDGWFLIIGNNENQKNVVLWPKYKQKYTEEKPPNISGAYKNQRWRGFFTQLIRGKNAYNTVNLLKYMCQKHDNKFESVELLYFLEETQPHPLPPKKSIKTSTLKLNCQN